MIYLLTTYFVSKDFSELKKENTFFLMLKKFIELGVKLRFFLNSVGRGPSSGNRKMLKLVSEVLIIVEVFVEVMNLLFEIINGDVSSGSSSSIIVGNRVIEMRFLW